MDKSGLKRSEYRTYNEKGNSQKELPYKVCLTRIISYSQQTE